MDQSYTVPAAALAGADRPDLNPLSISRFGTWAKCSALGYLRYNLKAETDFTAPHFVVGTVIHKALESYYKYEVDSVQEGADRALRELFKEHDELAAYDVCQDVAREDAAIIAKFETGEIKKPSGELYSAPRMTNAYKSLVKEKGLDRKLARLERVCLGKIKMPEGGVVELVSRVKTLVARYEKTIMIPRDHFEQLYVESKFDFVDVTPTGKEVRWLGYMDLLGKLKPEYGGHWVLRDYKSGRAQSSDDHQISADASLQLTLYEHVLVNKWGIDRSQLDVSLDFLDAAYQARTKRKPEHYQGLLGLVDTYEQIVGKPGLIKRLFYDSKECQGCEYRSACVAAFGDGSCFHKKLVPMTAPSNAVEDTLDGIWE